MKTLISVLCFIISSHAFAGLLDGKVFTFKYESGNQYHVSFHDSKVTWLGVGGSDHGKFETDNYETLEISENRYLVQWSEENKSFVTLVIDLNLNEVFSSGTSPNGNWLDRGKIE